MAAVQAISSRESDAEESTSLPLSCYQQGSDLGESATRPVAVEGSEGSVKRKRHRWKRAPGGWSCLDCGMFKSKEGILFPVGKAAINARAKGTPSCKALT